MSSVRLAAQSEDEAFKQARHAELQRKAALALAEEDSGIAGLDPPISESAQDDWKPMFAPLRFEDLGHELIICRSRLRRDRLEIIHTAQPDSASLSPQSEPALGHYASLKRDRPLVAASLNFAALFALSVLVLWLVLKSLLPPISLEDAPSVKIPKSFDDLQALNKVLQIYKTSHFYRVLGSFIVVYLFLQAFSLPGSMYLSILAGAMYGLWAVPLVCCCVASGATLCYALSMVLGPALLASSAKWRNRVAQWTDRIAAQGDNLISYLIVLRIAPLPPHWVVNVVAPHLGINVKQFWISTFCGVLGATYIHVSIGQGLDQMTSSADFKLFSVSNLLGLAGIVIAVLAPVGIRYLWKNELADAAGEADVGAIMLPAADEDMTLSSVKKDVQLVFLDANNQPLPARKVTRTPFHSEVKESEAVAEFRKQERRAGSEL